MVGKKYKNLDPRDKIRKKKNTEKKKEKYISLKEAAKLSGYSSDYIGYLIRTKKIKGKSFSLGKIWMVMPETVLNYKIRRKKEKKVAKNLKIKRLFLNKKISLYISVFRRNFSEGLRYAIPSVALFLLIGISALVIYAFPQEEQKIEIFPTDWSVQSNGETEWQNAHNVLILDLKNDNASTAFNAQNSAFIKLSDTLNDPIFNEENILSMDTTTMFLEGVKNTGEVIGPEETVSSSQEGAKIILPNIDGEMPEQQETSNKLQEKSNEEQEGLVIFTEQASLILSGFYFPEEEWDGAKEIQKINVKFSFASQGKELEDDQVLFEWSLDGELWNNLVVFNQNQNYSNAQNTGFFSFSLPADFDWQEIENLKIKVSYLSNNNLLERLSVYLDSLWLELIYDEKKEEESKIKKLSEDKSFHSKEEPEFDFQYIKKEKNILFSLVDSFEEKIGTYDFWQDINLTIEIEQVDDKTGFKTNSEVQTEISKKDDGSFSIKIKNPENFKPGFYKLVLRIEEDGDIQKIEQTFVWGILAINTNKSIYLPGEQAYLQMASLNDSGHAICNSNLSLEIISPDNTKINPEIHQSGQCLPNNVIDVADYFAYYQTSQTGLYQMHLINLDNGYDIFDSFEVQESVPFEVERIGPTRIYPPVAYQMTFKIKANQDFQGQIIEQVPKSFEINTQFSIFNFQSISNDSIFKQLIWDVDLKTGETCELSYQFDAPDISPLIYFLGPVQFVSGSMVFQEFRSWQIASDAVNNNGNIYYGDSADDGNLNFRTYTHATTLGNELTSQSTTANDITFVRTAVCPTRDEKITAHSKVDERLDVLLCTGGCDEQTDWATALNVSSIVDDSTLYRPFDLAYEQLSARAMVVYSKAADAGYIYYNIYDGSSWAGEASYQFDTTSPGTVKWLKLAAKGARLTSTRTDEILLALVDSNSDIYAARWDGDSWENLANVETTTSNVPLSGQAFDIAWENSSGEALVAWSATGTVPHYRYSIYTPSSGFGPPANGDYNYSDSLIMWLEMASNPIGDEISLITGDDESDAEYDIWDGSSFIAGSEDSSSELMTGKNIATQWEKSSGRAIFVYTDSNETATDMVCWTSGGGFSSVIGNVGSPDIDNIDDVEDLVLTASPNNNRMLLTRADIDDNLFALTYSAATGCDDADWSQVGSSALNAAVEGHGDGVNSIALVHTSTYTPYSAWSRNWRFSTDADVDDPSSWLADENTTPTEVEPEDFIRLRFQFRELSGMGQDNSRKKLQYTSGCNPNSSETACTWTDVGDVTETTAVFRYASYANSDPVCANCDDNTAVGTARLTGTTQNGAYITDKDDAAGSNMDHTALYIVEYDYVLKLENIYPDTTYYFRAYDLDSATAVFRRQDSGTTDCLSSTCTYPSLTTKINVSTNSAATAYSFQRKTWYDGTRYWRSFYNGNSIQFFYSTDQTNWYQNSNATIDAATNDFSIEADSIYAFIAYNDDYSVKTSIATSYPNTDFSWDTATTPYVANYCQSYYYPTISKDANNKLRVNATLEEDLSTFYCGCPIAFTYKGESVTYGTVSHNSECWMDRNLGASRVATAYNDSNAYGDLFQWGRLSDLHQNRNSGTTTTLSTTDVPGHSNFIYGMDSPCDWRDGQNNDLWQGVSGTNNPCPSGWRIPTHAEWNTERLSWSGNNRAGAYASPLKLTTAGWRSYYSAQIFSVGDSGYYWSSLIYDTNAYSLAFYASDAEMYYYHARATGLSVRCIKD